MKENQIITIETGKYLTNELAVKIAAAQWHSTKPEWVNRIRDSIYLDSYFYDCFCVVATNSCGDVVGRLYCIQNENDKSLWYYGDLFVAVPYRRMGIAGRMIRAAVGHLSEINAKRLRCYVEPENTPSIALQKSMGFYCKLNTILNHTEVYHFEKGKLILHLRYDFESNKFCDTVGQKLRYYRQLKGYSTLQLADMVSVVPETITLYENVSIPLNTKRQYLLPKCLKLTEHCCLTITQLL